MRRLLLDFGWQEARQEGSHVSFTKAGEGTITVPILDGRRVKRVYLGMICERLGLDG
ncbi:MAG: type II toxin-antitoxin system HicA family toxin [Chloroflexi bacterium]|nr:type II toxin-antitoxin system HicA family toxin [Chloroflexota bacterium]